jgi:hypothetical protein
MDAPSIAIKAAIVVAIAAPFNPNDGMRKIQRSELATTPIPASIVDFIAEPELLIIASKIIKRVKNPDPITSIASEDAPE